jgi:hypothetical protein
MSGDPTLEVLQADAVDEGVFDPGARVLGWRIEQLIAVGFDSDAAIVLALDRTIDLHEATEIVKRGCPPETAFRILV